MGRGDLKLLTNSFKELRSAFKVFVPFHDIRKVSVFGSARTRSDHPEFTQAVEFSRRMSEHQWMIITRAGDGIMGAAKRGAGRAGSFGVGIRLPHELKTNVVIADDPKLVNFKYFFIRKILFLKEASAVALFPGGFGTQDEGFEAMTMIQTGKTNLMPLVMIDAPGGIYWQHWRTYIKAELVLNGMIDEEDLALYQAGRRPRRGGRGDRRLLPPLPLDALGGTAAPAAPLVAPAPPPGALKRLNDTYAVSLLSEGRIEAHSTPLEGEGEDAEYPQLPRLSLAFNHKSTA